MRRDFLLYKVNLFFKKVLLNRRAYAVINRQMKLLDFESLTFRRTYADVGRFFKLAAALAREADDLHA